MTIPLQRQRHHRTDDAGADDSDVVTTAVGKLRAADIAGGRGPGIERHCGMWVAIPGVREDRPPTKPSRPSGALV